MRDIVCDAKYVCVKCEAGSLRYGKISVNDGVAASCITLIQGFS